MKQRLTWKWTAWTMSPKGFLPARGPSWAGYHWQDQADFPHPEGPNVICFCFFPRCILRAKNFWEIFMSRLGEKWEKRIMVTLRGGNYYHAYFTKARGDEDTGPCQRFESFSSHKPQWLGLLFFPLELSIILSSLVFCSQSQMHNGLCFIQFPTSPCSPRKHLFLLCFKGFTAGLFRDTERGWQK